MTQNANHILAVIVAGIGDLILASKAIRALKNGAPEARLNLLTSTEAATVARNYPYIDQVWSLPVRELRRKKSQIFGILKAILQLRKSRFDVAVNLYRVVSHHGALRMGLLFRLLNAAQNVGHDFKGFGLFLDKKVPGKAFENRHFTDAMLDLAKLAGGVPDGKGIEVFWDKSVEPKWVMLFPQAGQEKQPLCIGINPGADRPEKRWSPENHASLADRLVEGRGASIFLFSGPGEEHLASRIEKAMKHPVTNLAGKLSLNDLAYVISRLDLLVTNDSGPMHIAAAVETPVVALFGPEDPVCTRPYTSPDLYRIVQKELSCRPCISKRCDRPVCMASIKPEDVLQACLELLALR